MLTRLALLSSLVLAGCNPNSIIQENIKRDKIVHLQESQKGSNKVYVYSRLVDGKPSVTVSLFHFSSDPDTKGNVFIGTISDTTRTLGKADLQAEWLSEDSLLIRHSSELEVVKREQLVDNVHIVYDTPRKEED